MAPETHTHTHIDIWVEISTSRVFSPNRCSPRRSSEGVPIPVPHCPTDTNRTLIQQGHSLGSALDLSLQTQRPKLCTFDLLLQPWVTVINDLCYSDCILEVCFAASSSGPSFHTSEETTLSCSKKRDQYKHTAHLLTFPVFQILPKNLKLSLTHPMCIFYVHIERCA